MCHITKRTEYILQGMWETKTNTSLTCVKHWSVPPLYKLVLCPQETSWCHSGQKNLLPFIFFKILSHKYHIFLWNIPMKKWCSLFPYQKRPPRGWSPMWGTPVFQTQPNVIVERTMYKSLPKWLLYYCEELFISEEQGAFIIQRRGSPSKFSFLWRALFLGHTHKQSRAAGTESADCVTVWPLGQPSFLVPPVLTLACERLKLFQIFPPNIRADRTLHG